MRSFAVAALAVAIFVTTVLVGYTQANAVVCARGVHRQAVSARMGLLSRTVRPTGTTLSAHPGDN